MAERSLGQKCIWIIESIHKHYKQACINILTYIGKIYSIITYSTQPNLTQPNLGHVGPQVNKYPHFNSQIILHII